MTSTIGVTLISAIGCDRRRPRRPPLPEEAAAGFIAMMDRPFPCPEASTPLVDLT
jgi:hypothetical protein